MEIHHQVMPGGILQYVEIVVHHFGIVRKEEIHLDAGYAEALEPGKLLLAPFRLQEPVLRLRSAFPYPGSTGVVPEIDLHTLLAGIGKEVGDIPAVLHFRPFPVDETVRPAQIGCKVNERLVELEILRAMVVCPIYPG